MHWTSEVPTKEGWWWFRQYPSWPALLVHLKPWEKIGENGLRVQTLLQNGWEPKMYSEGGKGKWSNEPLLEPVTITFAPPAPPTEAEMAMIREMKPELDQMRAEMDQAERIREENERLREMRRRCQDAVVK